MVALGQQRAHREGARRQVVGIRLAPLLDERRDGGGGEHVVLPERRGEERGEYRLAALVAHDVVVELPAVLEPLPGGEGPLEEAQAADAERAAVGEQGVPFAGVELADVPVVLPAQPRNAARGLVCARPLRVVRPRQRRRHVAGERLDEPADVVGALMQGERHPHAGVLHRHGGEGPEMRVEAVGQDVPDDVVRHRRQTERDVADRRHVARGQRQARLLRQAVEERDPLAQRRLAQLELVGEVDPRRRDRGAEHRGLDRAGEHERVAERAHAPPQLGVGEDQRPAGGGERLVQRRGDHQSIVHPEGVQGGAAPVAAGPADAVRVVHVQVQPLKAFEQRGEFGERREVGVHAVYAVRQVPDAPPRLAEALDHRLELVHPVVADHLDRRALETQLAGRDLDAVVGLLVEHPASRLPISTGSAARCANEVGRRHERVSTEHLPEQPLELRIGRRRQCAREDENWVP